MYTAFAVDRENLHVGAMKCTVHIETHRSTDMTVESKQVRVDASVSVLRKGFAWVVSIKSNHNSDSFTTQCPRLIDRFADQGKLTMFIPEYRKVLFFSGADESLIRDLTSRIRGSLSLDNKENVPVAVKAPANSILQTKPFGKPGTPTKGSNGPSNRKGAFEALAPKQNGFSPANKKKKGLMSPKKNVSPAMNRAFSQPSFVVEQQQIIRLCREGRNVFFTGGAGTGKSTLLGSVIEVLRTVHSSEAVFVTATTGLAACAIGGTTLHQFAGIPLLRNENECDVEEICKKVKSHFFSLLLANYAVTQALSTYSTMRRWRQARVLLVDEVSMLSPKLLEVGNKSSDPFIMERKVHC